MGSILDFLKPICLFANRNKKNKHKKRHQNGQKQKDEKKEQLLKNNQLTLQDCILSSPSLNRSSPLPLATSSKRVHPNPSFVTENLSMETQTLLLGDHLNPLFEYDNNDDDDEMGMGIKKTKKRVSFRTPEVADIFILTIESPELQDFQPKALKAHMTRGEDRVLSELIRKKGPPSHFTCRKKDKPWA